MSSRLTTAALIGYASAPFVGLAALAILHRPIPPPAAPLAPSVVWYAVCPVSGYWGPYSSPDACRALLDRVINTCHKPLSAPNIPNPAFVAIAHVCRDDYDGYRCDCEAHAVVPLRAAS